MEGEQPGVVGNPFDVVSGLAGTGLRDGSEAVEDLLLDLLHLIAEVDIVEGDGDIFAEDVEEVLVQFAQFADPLDEDQIIEPLLAFEVGDFVVVVAAALFMMIGIQDLLPDLFGNRGLLQRTDGVLELPGAGDDLQVVAVKEWM